MAPDPVEDAWEGTDGFRLLLTKGTWRWLSLRGRGARKWRQLYRKEAPTVLNVTKFR